MSVPSFDVSKYDDDDDDDDDVVQAPMQHRQASTTPVACLFVFTGRVSAETLARQTRPGATVE